MEPHRQPRLADPARNLWEAILGSQCFEPAKVMKDKVGEGRVSKFFDT
jgi:hypothetical protein